MKAIDRALRDAGILVIPIAGGWKAKITRLIKKITELEEPRRDVLDAVIDVAQRSGARTIIAESRYMDQDYLDTYNRHYPYALRPKSTRCTRLHFFARAVPKAKIFKLPSDVVNAYLGYCSLRPTGEQYVSRTVLAPPVTLGSTSICTHGTARFRAQLLGQSLEVEGAPFIQQDASTFVCAGAALWSVGLFMHERHGAPRYFPYQIMELAGRAYRHSQLRSGLSVPQIGMALERMKLNPVVESASDITEIKNEVKRAGLVCEMADFIHVFVDSGLPPILAFWDEEGEGHAVTIVGCDLVKRRSTLPVEINRFLGTLRNSCFVDTFYAMDDSCGPYTPIRIRHDPDVDCLSLDTFRHFAVIAPMPDVAFVEFDDAYDEMARVLKSWGRLVSGAKVSLRKPRGARFLPEEHLLMLDDRANPIVLRWALLDSRAWRKQVVLNERIHPPLMRRYQALELPRYVWVIEISDFKHTNKSSWRDRRILGEVILDAAADPYSAFDNLISIHVKGLLLDWRSRQFELLETDFRPYPPLRRSIFS